MMMNNNYHHNQSVDILFKRLIRNIVISKLIFKHVYDIHRSLPQYKYLNPIKGSDLISQSSLATMLKYGRNDLFYQNIYYIIDYFKDNNNSVNSNNIPVVILREAMAIGNLSVVQFLLEHLDRSKINLNYLKFPDATVINIIKQGYDEIFNILLSLNFEIGTSKDIIGAIISSHRYKMLARYTESQISAKNRLCKVIDLPDEDPNECEHVDIDETLGTDSEKTYDLLLRYTNYIYTFDSSTMTMSEEDHWQNVILDVLEMGELEAARLLFENRSFEFQEAMLEHAADFGNDHIKLVLKQYEANEIIITEYATSSVIRRGDIESLKSLLEYTDLTESDIQQAIGYRSSLDIINFILEYIESPNRLNIEKLSISNSETPSVSPLEKYRVDNIYYKYCSVDLLKRLISNKRLDCRFNYLLNTAIANNLYDIIEFIMENQKMFQIDYPSAIGESIIAGNIDLLARFIKENPNLKVELPDPQSCYSKDDTYNHSQIFQDGEGYISAVEMILNSSVTIEFNTNDLYFLIQRRITNYPFLEQVIRMLHQRDIIQHNNTILDVATFSAPMSLLELLEEMPIYYSQHSVYNAATRGSLEIFRYIIERHMQPCTPGALKAASDRGYLDIVKYVVENRLVAYHYIVDTLNRSIENGYQDQVSYLLDQIKTKPPLMKQFSNIKYIRQSLKYPEILMMLLPNSEIDLKFLLRFLMAEESNAHLNTFNIVLEFFLKANNNNNNTNNNNNNNNTTTEQISIQPFIDYTPKQLVKNNQYNELKSIFDLNLVNNSHKSLILDEIYRLAIQFGHINIIKLYFSLLNNNNNKDK